MAIKNGFLQVVSYLDAGMSPDLAAAIIKEMAIFADEQELAITGQDVYWSTRSLLGKPIPYLLRTFVLQTALSPWSAIRWTKSGRKVRATKSNVLPNGKAVKRTCSIYWQIVQQKIYYPLELRLEREKLKRWGKSPPRWWWHQWHGKPCVLKSQIGFTGESHELLAHILLRQMVKWVGWLTLSAMAGLDKW